MSNATTTNKEEKYFTCKDRINAFNMLSKVTCLNLQVTITFILNDQIVYGTFTLSVYRS